MTEQKLMRAILIDPVAKTVTEVEHDNATYKNIYKMLSDPDNGLEVDTFDVVRIDDHDSIFVDDEGLLKVDDGQPAHYFQYKGARHPLAGRGLILGCDEEGETVGAKISLEEVRANVTFPRVRFVGFKPYPEGATAIGPDGKPWPLVGHTVIFEPLPEDAQ